MSLDLSLKAQLSLQRVNIEPQIALKIEGIDVIYGSNPIMEKIKVGDVGLKVDGSWKIGGGREIANQLTAISLGQSTNVVTQQLTPDTAQGSSITSFQVSLIDFNNAISNIISPNVGISGDIIGRRCKIYLGLSDLNFPEDYNVIFRGIIENVSSSAGIITFNISHPDIKKRQELFAVPGVTLNGAIGNTIFDATVTVDEVPEELLLPLTSGLPINKPVIEFLPFLKIDNEFLYVVSKTPTTLLCTRGALSSVITTHANDATGIFNYRLSAETLDMALCLMLSGWNGPFAESVPLKSIRYFNPLRSEANGIIFNKIDLNEEYGLVVGDELTITGATESGNNIGPVSITEIGRLENGDAYVLLSGANFTQEITTNAVCSFRSQYDCLPTGLKMHPDEIDILQFKALRKKLNVSLNQIFYFSEPTNIRDFIDQKLLKPMAFYTLPRKARSSVNLHLPPLPNQSVTILNKTNMRNPASIKIQRSITKNFYNTIIYKYNKDLFEDKYQKSIVYVDDDSRQRIKVGVKALVIESPGIRDDQYGYTFSIPGYAPGNLQLLGLQAEKRLNRYKFGAEFLEGVQVLYSVGYPIEIGDSIIVDFTDLQVTNIETGKRDKSQKLYEVINKSLEIKTGNVSLTLVDTGFAIDSRFGLIAPSSKIKTVVSNQQFVIEPSYSKKFGDNEGQKWTRYTSPTVKVMSPDGVVRYENATIDRVVGNEVFLKAPLSFTPISGDIMTLTKYNESTDELRLLYAFMKDSAFDDGKPQHRQY